MMDKNETKLSVMGRDISSDLLSHIASYHLNDDYRLWFDLLSGHVAPKDVPHLTMGDLFDLNVFRNALLNRIRESAKGDQDEQR